MKQTLTRTFLFCLSAIALLSAHMTSARYVELYPAALPEADQFSVIQLLSDSNLEFSLHNGLIIVDEEQKHSAQAMVIESGLKLEPLELITLDQMAGRVYREDLNEMELKESLKSSLGLVPELKAAKLILPKKGYFAYSRLPIILQLTQDDEISPQLRAGVETLLRLHGLDPDKLEIHHVAPSISPNARTFSRRA